MKDEDFAKFVRDFETGEIENRIHWLAVFAERGTPDPRLLPYLEEMLKDDRPCIIAIPYHYGEVRWLAAQALAATREQLGIQEPVRLEGVVLPMSERELSQAMKRAGIDYPHTKSDEEYFVDLREAGALTLVDLDLTGPGSIVPWCTPEYPTGGYALSRKMKR